MALTLVGAQLAPDTWQFTVTGVDPATTEFTIDYGDGTAPVVTAVDPSGTTIVSHLYMDPGVHTYTVTVTAAKTPVAATLQALHDLYPGTLQDIADAPNLSSLIDISADSETATMQVTVHVGPATITASVQAADPIPVIRLDAWVGDPQSVASWTISRDVAGMDSVTIWTAPGGQQAVSLLDDTAPLNTTISYRLTITFTDGTTAVVLSNQVIITGTVGCYLTDPHTGETMRITLQTWPARERAARRSVLEVLSRPDPVVVSDVHTWPSGTWTIYTSTDLQTAQLIRILTDTGIVVLRTQPTSSIASVTASIGTITENRYTGRGGDQRRSTDVEIQEITPPPDTALPLPATLGGLNQLVPTTLADLNLLRPTLLQLSEVRTG